MSTLAQVKQITGRQLHLGIFEEVIGFRREPGRLVLAIRRARVKELRFSYRVTHTGSTLYEFKLIDGAWVMQEPVTIWHKLPEPELHSSFAGRTPAEHADRLAWEDDCFRPGNDDWPMDSLARQRQGYW